MRKVQITARVPANLADWLKARAEKNRRSENMELVVLLEQMAARDAASVEGVAA